MEANAIGDTYGVERSDVGDVDLVSSIMTCIKVLIGDQRNTYPHNSGGGGSILYISICRAVGGAF